MAEIQWDQVGDRLFEVGVDRGVLYPPKSPGVPWNGLIRVSQGAEGGAADPHYIDGFKYRNEVTPEEYVGTIEAFTYPEEFSNLNGDLTSGTGLHYGQQDRPEFSLCYRTKIGNDVDFESHAYKLHLLYNVRVAPSTEDYGTIGESVDPMNFSWAISTRPEIIPGRRATAELVIDSRKALYGRLYRLERILYGDKNEAPRMPTMWEVVEMFNDWPYIQINRRPTTGLNPLSYKGLHDLQGNNRTGLYTAPPETRLKKTAIPGLYKI